MQVFSVFIQRQTCSPCIELCPDTNAPPADHSEERRGSGSAAVPAEGAPPKENAVPPQDQRALPGLRLAWLCHMSVGLITNIAEG